MGLKYHMVGKINVAPGYARWSVLDKPDPDGKSSGYGKGEVSNISISSIEVTGDSGKSAAPITVTIFDTVTGPTGYTAPADPHQVIVFNVNNAGGSGPYNAVILPHPLDVSPPSIGDIIEIKNASGNANAIPITSSGSIAIDDSPSISLALATGVLKLILTKLDDGKGAAVWNVLQNS